MTPGIRPALSILLGVVACAAAGCGGGDGSATGGLPMLFATVDATDITLRTEDGAEVTTRLRPGRYLLRIDDRSTAHNFHLGGALPGKKVATDVATDVAGTGEKTTLILLRDHESYHYFCDAHPASMNVTFSVHGWPFTRN